MKRKDVTGIMLTLPVICLLLVGVLPKIGSVVDFDNESENFAAQSGVDWWPMFRHDHSHTGSTSNLGPMTNQTLWIYETSCDFYGPSPAVSTAYSI